MSETPIYDAVKAEFKFSPEWDGGTANKQRALKTTAAGRRAKRETPK